ncbi:hypothetical protein [Microcella sp.]|uniref:hypothetical protein n=1 Tax=Microcella sp. TaxID=1913979 RepID=UPI0039187828
MSESEERSRGPVRVVAVVTLVGVLAAAFVFISALVAPSFGDRAMQRCTALGLEAGGDTVGLSANAFLPLQWTCTYSDESGRTQRSTITIGDLAS